MREVTFRVERFFVALLPVVFFLAAPFFAALFLPALFLVALFLAALFLPALLLVTLFFFATVRRPVFRPADFALGLPRDDFLVVAIGLPLVSSQDRRNHIV
jgi:hypothetical protein